jgi:Kae1-associated kinase Bud32
MIDQNLLASFSSLLVIEQQINKGSEAYLYKGLFLGRSVIIKERQPKKYRHPLIDQQIRKERTRIEARLLSNALIAGIPVPALLGIAPENTILIMEFIEGKPLGELLAKKGSLSHEQEYDLFFNFGVLTGRLHSLNIVHGDLTIYNALVIPNLKLYLIDFGLGYNSNELESLATDLYTFENSLRAFNPENYEKWFEKYLEGYFTAYQFSREVFQQLHDVHLRGRYIRRDKAELLDLGDQAKDSEV